MSSRPARAAARRGVAGRGGAQRRRLGQPVESSKPIRQTAKNADRKPINPGLEPKTVVSTHRMLHRAWEDFELCGWAKRNFVADAHPPRVPRKGRKVWTVGQLQTFLQRSRSDRFFALWVLEATSGMRRCEVAGARRDLLDLDAGTLAIEGTRVVVDGKVIEAGVRERVLRHPRHPRHTGNIRKLTDAGCRTAHEADLLLLRVLVIPGRRSAPRPLFR